jgi:hypothetical protein
MKPDTWSYQYQRPDHIAMFAAYGTACCRAQEFEALLLTDLQYSLASDGQFASLKEVDESAEKPGKIPMGQVVGKLAKYLDQDLRLAVGRSLDARNALSHGFFCARTGGVVMTPAETTEAIAWCEAAGEEFGRTCRRLERRVDELRAAVYVDPDSIVPGMQARMDALARGEWP